MNQPHLPAKRLSALKITLILVVLVIVGLVIVSFNSTSSSSEQATLPTIVEEETPFSLDEVTTGTPTPRPTVSATATSRPSATPTVTSTPTPTPTPTLDLAKCNAAGCGLEARALPTVEYDPDMLLAFEPHRRRICAECPKNTQLSTTELNTLLRADPATLAQLRTIVLSQGTYQIAPGIVYIVFDNVHHVVIDLKESGYVLRNIIPETNDREMLITPSFCYTPNSLVVVDADYHGLNGSNKTETGRDLFYHLGRAALFQIDGEFDIDVIRERERYDRTTLSWGGGPLFIWDGRYDFNPEQEWFDEQNLEHYRATRWAKISVAISKDRKYLFLSLSYNLLLREHAANIIRLGQAWGIEVERAMRFDGSENAYMSIRLGNHMVPLLSLREPLIANCFAVESE